MSKLMVVQEAEQSKNAAMEKIWRAYWRGELSDVLRATELQGVGTAIEALDHQSSFSDRFVRLVY